MTRKREPKGLWLRMICAVALLFLGLAHRPAVVIAQASPSELAYQLPDGTAPDLCVPQGTEKRVVTYPACDACRLSASVILPPAPEVISYLAPAAAPVYVVPTLEPIIARVDPATFARGPPSSFES